MRFILIFFFLSTIAIAASNICGTNSANIPVAADKTEFSPRPSDSLNVWFETNMNIYIPDESMPFLPTEYKHALRQGIKDTLNFEYWLGVFTIVDMVNENGYTMVNFSKPGHKKLMFITPTYFVLTSYMDPEKETGMTYGASLIYFPKDNVVHELDNFIVFGVYGDTLDGALEHYQIGEKRNIEYGQYTVHNDIFTPIK